MLIAQQTATIVDTLPTILLIDLTRYLLGAGGIFIVINWILAGTLRQRKIRPDNPSRRQIIGEFWSSMRTVVVFASVGTSIWIAGEHGLTKLYDDPALYGWSWFVLSIIFLIVLHDTWFYWTHRLMHSKMLFRRMHLHHHKSHNPSPFSSYSFAVGEAFLMALYFPIVLSIIPVSELAAFIFTAHMMLINALHHCGYEVYPKNRLGQPLLGWMTTTTHHDLHHACGGYNFGLYFTFWDRVMGTEHPDYLGNFSAAIRSADREPQKREYSLLQNFRCNSVAPAMISIVSGIALYHPPSEANSSAVSLITGQWASEGYSVIVEIKTCDQSTQTICGYLQWAWKHDTISTGAWDRPMLSKFIYENDTWRNGRLTHPVTNQEYRGTIRQLDKNTIQLDGCVAILFCDQQLWRRLQSLPHMPTSHEITQQLKP